jgi:hypothetical protein
MSYKFRARPSYYQARPPIRLHKPRTTRLKVALALLTTVLLGLHLIG